MDQEISARIMSLPRLSRANEAKGAVRCKVCGEPAPFFDVVDFWKRPTGYPFGASGVEVPYFRCGSCGFLFATFCDGWSDADFARAIYNNDYRKVDAEYDGSRALRAAEQMTRLLGEFREKPILDYGAGNGVLGRTLNERGFNVRSYDPFANPERPRGKFAIILCLQVVEHSPDPKKLFADMRSLLERDGCMVFSQSLQPADIEAIRCNWWFISPRNATSRRSPRVPWNWWRNRWP